jgi:hypothetical protein
MNGFEIIPVVVGYILYALTEFMNEVLMQVIIFYVSIELMLTEIVKFFSYLLFYSFPFMLF